jgi:hypothetical protein
MRSASIVHTSPAMRTKMRIVLPAKARTIVQSIMGKNMRGFAMNDVLWLSSGAISFRQMKLPGRNAR